MEERRKKKEGRKEGRKGGRKVERKEGRNDLSTKGQQKKARKGPIKRASIFFSNKKEREHYGR